MHAGSGAVSRAYHREACEQQFEILRVGEDDQTPNGVACPNVGRGAAPTEGSSIGPRLGRATRPSRSLNDENLIPPRNLLGRSGASPYHLPGRPVTGVAARSAQVPVYVLAVFRPA